MSNDLEWEAMKGSLRIGTRVHCRIKEHHPYGVHTAISGIKFEGLIQITDFKDRGRMTPAEYPALDSEVEAVVLGFKEHGKQIWLGIRPSQLSGERDTNPSVKQRRTLPVGLRVNEKNEFEFFGVREVNDLLQQGADVVGIQEGTAIVIKQGEEGDTVRLRLNGFSMNIVIDDVDDK